MQNTEQHELIGLAFKPCEKFKMRFVETLASSSLRTVVAVLAGGAAAVAVAVFLLGIAPAGAIAFYFVVWWIVLFVTLPLGVRSQQELGATLPGTEPGAPFSARMRERALLTTALADVVFLIAVMLLPLSGL